MMARQPGWTTAMIPICLLLAPTRLTTKVLSSVEHDGLTMHELTDDTHVLLYAYDDEKQLYFIQ
jgi:hypothetical protein